MFRLHRIALLALGLLAVSGTLRAQSADALIQQGIEAYREERFEDALRAFEAAVRASPDAAEAHYLLARVLFDTPLRDEGRAARALERARELDPDNLQYMVARLQQLRTDTPNFIAEMLRAQQRVELANAILERDPENAFAHEELGTHYIRDYYYYRNLIDLPFLSFQSQGRSTADDLSDDFDESIVEDMGQTGGGSGNNNPNLGTIQAEMEAQWASEVDLGPAAAVGTNDRFNLDRILGQGVGVLDLSRRADHAYERAVHHLNLALATDPRRPIYDHLMRLNALAGRWDAALETLGQMLVYFPDDPETWLYLGLANHRLGNGDAAAVAFGEAMDRLPEEQRAAYEDIALLLTDDQLEAYRADPETFARRFWTSEDPRFLTVYNERRLEHYARLTYADLMYRSDDLDLPGWETQRGKIHVRYGVPRVDVVLAGEFQNVLEAFGTRHEGFEMRDGSAQMASNNRFNIWDYGDFRFVFEDPFQNGEFRLYSPPADLFASVGGSAVDRMDYERIARETFRTTPERYDFEPPGRRIGLPYLVTAFKGDDGRTDLYVHYGIPLAERVDPAADELVDLTVKTGAFLISQDRDILAERRRTLYGLRTAQVEPFAETQLWTDTQALDAPPGTHEVSVEFETVGGGTSAVQRRAVEVPDFSGRDLALSSIMLAYHVEDTDADRLPGLVVRDGLAIKPAPWSVFNHAQPIYLYFEVYNLGMQGERTDYEVEAQLRPKDTSTGIARLARNLFGGRDPGVSSQFEVQGDRPDDAQYVILDAAEQEPGFYTLTLQIRDRVSGRTVEETTDLYLE